jgi:uncharacterized protein YbjQ (UPF0145 family)
MAQLFNADQLRAMGYSEDVIASKMGAANYIPPPSINLNDMYSDVAQKKAAINEISKNYNELALSKMNEYNRRGMLGSSVFGEDMNQQVNYGLGQSLASYEGQSEANRNNAMQNLIKQKQDADNAKINQSQFAQTMAYNQAQATQKNKLLQQEQRFNQDKQRYPNNSSWWGR